MRCLLILGIGAFFMIVSCKSEYERLVESELSTEVRKDSLFLGFVFGMEEEEFFAHCRNLNKQRIVNQGRYANSLEFVVSDLKYDGSMTFYPTFHEKRIYEMNAMFNYKSWSPWNKSRSADSLQLDVLNLMKGWFGNDFIEMKDNGETVYAKVDGNRRVLIYKEKERNVKVLFTDLLMMKEVEKINKETSVPTEGRKDA